MRLSAQYFGILENETIMHSFIRLLLLKLQLCLRQKFMEHFIRILTVFITLDIHPSLFFFTFMRPCIVTNFFVIKPNRCTNFTNLFCLELYVFQTVPLSIIRSLFTVHSAMVYVIHVWRELSSRTRMEPSWSCSKAVYKPVWHIPLLSLQWINSWWWTEELSETCRVSWQNTFVKLVHLLLQRNLS